MPLPRHGRVLLAIVLVAFALRFAVALGREGERGYVYYVEMARNLGEKGALYRSMPFDQGDRYAIRTPGYPLVLAALDAAPGALRAKVALFGAACGAASVALASLLARRLFGDRPALATAAVIALWPHAVLHDGALQDTALYTTLFLALLLITHRLFSGEERLGTSVAAGAAAAAAVLVRVALLPTALVLLAWPLLGTARRRVALAGVSLLALGIGLTPWLARNARVVGRPVLTSDGGRSLWLGNNAQLFEAGYPRVSIDRAEVQAWFALPPATRQHVQELGRDELAQDAWFRAEATRWIRANPGDALSGALRKAWASFSPWYSPRGTLVKQLVHLATYGPVALLAFAALLRHRARWRELGMLAACAALLAAQSAVFFGHSAYRAYLDPVLILLACSWITARD